MLSAWGLSDTFCSIVFVIHQPLHCVGLSKSLGSKGLCCNQTQLVLFVTSPTGYHQKCHSPPIPASALELDTPWNCAYCLRGTKCPYLTESLDVLQNLLSDNEEGQSHDEVDSVTTAESDEGGEEFPPPPPPQPGKFLAPPKPQKKRVNRTQRCSKPLFLDIH